MKSLVVANWKMNPSRRKKAQQLFSAIEKGCKNIPRIEVVVCPPFVHLSSLGNTAKRVKLGSQNCSWQNKGPLTGEVSPKMLKDMGCKYVILGHSERKKYLSETKEQIAKKVKAAIQTGLRVLLCVENAQELSFLQKKTRLSQKNLIFVYEPSFAISTEQGRKPSPKTIAREVRAMKDIVGERAQVLYGGSVNAKSVGKIMREGKVQGVLVGASSLDAKKFLDIVKRSQA